LSRCSCIQVRTTDTNVDDGVDLLACVSLPLAASDLLAELLHVVQNGVDPLDYALAIDLHLLVGGVAKGDMVDSAVLGEVDLLTSEHIIAELLEASLFGELDEKLQCLLGDEVLGKVEQDLGVLGIVLESTAEFLESLHWFSRDTTSSRSRHT
jgi:hypothetical protein